MIDLFYQISLNDITVTKSLDFFFFLIFFAFTQCVCVYACECVYMTHMWMSQGHLGESVLSFYHVRSGDQIQIIRLRDLTLYFLNHFAGPSLGFLYNLIILLKYFFYLKIILLIQIFHEDTAVSSVQGFYFLPSSVCQDRLRQGWASLSHPRGYSLLKKRTLCFPLPENQLGKLYMVSVLCDSDGGLGAWRG